MHASAIILNELIDYCKIYKKQGCCMNLRTLLSSGKFKSVKNRTYSCTRFVILINIIFIREYGYHLINILAFQYHKDNLIIIYCYEAIPILQF
jgi:hypothetical protein